MYEGQSRREAGYNRRGDQPSRVHGRPDRIALWAVYVALAAVIAAAASAATADAQGGTGGASTTGECIDARFGDRPLRLGDCGDDVRTLNWVMSSKAYAAGVGLDESFDDPTDGAVRTFQERAGLDPTGVVDDGTRAALTGSMKRHTATWYGPGFWGNETACGKELERDTIGVAHKRLPCGTKVTFYRGGRWVRAKVIDRGPFTRGVRWDLTQAAAERLGMEQTESVRSAVIDKP